MSNQSSKIIRKNNKYKATSVVFMILCILSLLVASKWSFVTWTKALFVIYGQLVPVIIVAMIKDKIRIYRIIDMLIFSLTVIDIFAAVISNKLNIWHVDKYCLYLFLTYVYYLTIIYFLINERELKVKEKIVKCFNVVEVFITVCTWSGCLLTLPSMYYFGRFQLTRNIAMTLILAFIWTITANILSGMMFNLNWRRNK